MLCVDYYYFYRFVFILCPVVILNKELGYIFIPINDTCDIKSGTWHCNIESSTVLQWVRQSAQCYIEFGKSAIILK